MEQYRWSRVVGADKDILLLKVNGRNRGKPKLLGHAFEGKSEISNEHRTHTDRSTFHVAVASVGDFALR